MNIVQWAPALASLLIAIPAVLGLFRVKQEREKLQAERDKTSADARQITVRTDIEGSGATVIKDISEAAAGLVVVLSTRNEKLEDRVQKLESEVEALQEENRQKRMELHQERERRQIAQDAFEERTKELMRELRAAKRQIQTKTEADGHPDSGA